MAEASREENAQQESDLLELTASVVAAFVSNNRVATTEVSQLIAEVSQALRNVANVKREEPSEPPVPAVPIKKSVTPDYIISLEDGKKFKSLKRALSARYGMSPEQYRSKWGLPADYPMVAPNYSAARSKLAKDLGLGRRRGQSPAVPSQPAKPKRARKTAK